MSVARKILSNTGVQVAGKALTSLLAIVSIKLITLLLGVSGYGEYTAVYEFLGFFAIAADLGIFTIAVREMATDEKKIEEILGNILGLRIVLSLLVMSIAVVVAFLIPQYDDSFIPMGVAIVSITTVLNLISSIMSTVLQVHLRMEFFTIATVVSKIIAVSGISWVIFVLEPSDPKIAFASVLIAGAVGNVFLLGITSYFVRKFVSIKPQFNIAFWKHLLRISLPYGVALILSTIYFKLDVLLLSVMRSSEEVGLYGVAMRVLENLAVITFFFMNAVLPVMARAWKTNKKKVQSIVQHSFDFLMAIGFPVLVGLGLFAAPIVEIISSPEFVSGNTYEYGADIAMSLLMFALVFSFLSSLFGFTLVALERQKNLLIINAAGVTFNLVSNLFVIPLCGFRGAAVTSILSEILIAFFLYLSVKKILSLRLSFVRVGKMFVSAVFMGGVTFGVFTLVTPSIGEKWALLLVIPLAFLLYSGALYLTKCITNEHIQLLKKEQKTLPLSEDTI